MLENRLTPATIWVTTNADNVANPPAGSLRAAVAAANNGDTIEFNTSIGNWTSNTITLAGPISLGSNFSTNVTIDGTNQSITVSGGGSFQIFQLVNASSWTINNLTLFNGYVLNGNGGAVFIHKGSSATFNSDNFAYNMAATNNANGNGGAIGNSGYLTVDECNFGDNTAEQFGGAIESASGVAGGSGTLTVSNSNFDANSGTVGGGAIYTSDPTTLTSDNFGLNSPNKTSGKGAR